MESLVFSFITLYFPTKFVNVTVEDEFLVNAGVSECLLCLDDFVVVVTELFDLAVDVLELFLHIG